MDMSQLANQYISGQWRSGGEDKVLVDQNPFSDEAAAEFRVVASSVLSAHSTSRSFKLRSRRLCEQVRDGVRHRCGGPADQFTKVIGDLAEQPVAGVAVERDEEPGGLSRQRRSRALAADAPQ
jgi:hypothetical protein